MAYGYVYKITHKKTQRCYIGRHANKVVQETQQFDPKYWGSGTYIHRAIKKYGKRAFTREILSWADTEEELCKLEQKYIKQFNSMVPYGYNQTSGGETNEDWKGASKLGIKALKKKLSEDEEFAEQFRKTQSENAKKQWNKLSDKMHDAIKKRNNNEQWRKHLSENHGNGKEKALWSNHCRWHKIKKNLSCEYCNGKEYNYNG